MPKQRRFHPKKWNANEENNSNQRRKQQTRPPKDGNIDFDFSFLEETFLNPDARQHPVFLFLGCSVNPPHVEHLNVLKAARDACISHARQLNVVHCFFVPNTNRYVSRKLGNEAISLEHRVQMLKIMVENDPDISVIPWGDDRASRAATAVKNLIRSRFGVKITTLDVGGADNALKYKSMEKLNTNKVLVARPGSDLMAEYSRLERVYSDSPEELRKLRDIVIAEIPLRDVSSTKIRKLMKRGEWDQLVVLNFLHPGVVLYLQKHLHELQPAIPRQRVDAPKKESKAKGKRGKNRRKRGSAALQRLEREATLI